MTQSICTISPPFPPRTTFDLFCYLIKESEEVLCLVNKLLQCLSAQYVSIKREESVQSIGTVCSVLTAGGRLGFVLRPFR